MTGTSRSVRAAQGILMIRMDVEAPEALRELGWLSDILCMTVDEMAVLLTSQTRDAADDSLGVLAPIPIGSERSQKNIWIAQGILMERLDASPHVATLTLLDQASKLRMTLDDVAEVIISIRPDS